MDRITLVVLNLELAGVCIRSLQRGVWATVALHSGSLTIDLGPLLSVRRPA